MPTTNYAIDYLVAGQSGHDVTVNTDLDSIDTALGGYLVKAVGGSSNVTLTAVEYRNRSLEFTGTLTGDIAVIVPATKHLFVVYNNTTGAFTLTVRTSGGTGRVILSTDSTLAYNNGTDVSILNNYTSNGSFSRTGPASTLAVGIQAYYKFDGNALDAVGSNNLTNNNAVTFTTGILGSGAVFNGTNQSLSIADNASLSMGAEVSFSICAWVRPTVAATYQAILGKSIPSGDTGANVSEYRIILSSSIFTFSAGNNSTRGDAAASSVTTANNTWYFLVAWHDAVLNTVNIQVNLGTIHSTAYSAGSYDSAQAFIIGTTSATASLFFGGMMDGIGIWKKVLTSTERTALYNAGLGADYPFSAGGRVNPLFAGDNIGLNTSTFGSNTASVLGIGVTSSPPVNSPANVVQLYAKARTTNKAGLAIWAEDSTPHIIADRVGFMTQAPSTDVGIDGQSARTMAVERHATANTAGNTLTLRSGGATSGATDKDAGDIIIVPGVSTGLGRGKVRIQGYTPALSTGTADNTVVDRLIFSCFKILVNNTVTALVNCTLISNMIQAGIIRYSVVVFDSTDLQVEEGMLSYHVTNKGGVFANNVCLKSGNQQALTAGTLTVTWTITAANPAVLSLNANSSLTPATGYPRVTYTLENFSQQAVTIL